MDNYVYGSYKNDRRFVTCIYTYIHVYDSSFKWKQCHSNKFGDRTYVNIFHVAMFIFSLYKV